MSKKKTKTPCLIGSTSLFRGDRKTNKWWLFKNEQNRHSPKTSIFDDWIDKAFLEVFGEAARDTALFCSKSPEVAATYGKVYQIIPACETHFYYSNWIDDLHDLNWVRSQIYSRKEFDDEQAAAFGIRVLTSSKSEDRTLRKDIYQFFGFSMKPESALKFLLTKYPYSGPRFVQDFYCKGTTLEHLSNVRKYVEILLMCDYAWGWEI